jgi:hypothetical protein
MKYAAEMGSGAMICTPSFMKIGSGIQKLMGGYTDTQTAWKSRKECKLIKIKTNIIYKCEQKGTLTHVTWVKT